MVGKRARSPDADAQPPKRKPNAHPVRAPNPVGHELLYRQWADLEASSNRKPSKFAGAIIDIEIVNLRVLRNFKFVMTPHLNFIGGQNGAGKSSIIMGIQLACGASAADCWRGMKIVDLISLGQKSMSVKLTLWNAGLGRVEGWGNRLTLKRTWKRPNLQARTTTSTCELSDEIPNGPVLKKSKSVSAVLQKLFINPSLPTCVLTQFAAKDFFTSSRPAQLNSFFNSGLGATLMQKRLTSAEEDVAVGKITLQRHEAPLAKLKKQVEEWKYRSHAADRFEELRGVVRELKGAKIFFELERLRLQAKEGGALIEEEEAEKRKFEAMLEEEEGEVTRLSDNVKEMTNKIAELETAYKAAQRKTQDQNRLIERLQQRHRDKKAALHELQRGVDRAKERVRMNGDLLENAKRAFVRNREKGRQAREKARAEREMKRAEARVALQRQSGVEQLREQYAEKERALKEAQSQVDEATAARVAASEGYATARAAASDARSAVEGALREVNELKMRIRRADVARTGSSGGRKATRLMVLPSGGRNDKSAAADSVDALVQLLQRDASSNRPQYRFDRPPIGPIGALLSARPGADPRLVTFAELHLAQLSRLWSWFVSSAQDRETLLRAAEAVGMPKKDFKYLVINLLQYQTSITGDGTLHMPLPDVVLPYNAVDVTDDDVQRRWPGADAAWCRAVRATILTQLQQTKLGLSHQAVWYVDNRHVTATAAAQSLFSRARESRCAPIKSLNACAKGRDNELIHRARYTDGPLTVDINGAGTAKVGSGFMTWQPNDDRSIRSEVDVDDLKARLATAEARVRSMEQRVHGPAGDETEASNAFDAADHKEQQAMRARDRAAAELTRSEAALISKKRELARQEALATAEDVDDGDVGGDVGSVDDDPDVIKAASGLELAKERLDEASQKLREAEEKREADVDDNPEETAKATALWRDEQNARAELGAATQQVEALAPKVQKREKKIRKLKEAIGALEENIRSNYLQVQKTEVGVAEFCDQVFEDAAKEKDGEESEGGDATSASSSSSDEGGGERSLHLARRSGGSQASPSGVRRAAAGGRGVGVKVEPSVLESAAAEQRRDALSEDHREENPRGGRPRGGRRRIGVSGLDPKQVVEDDDIAAGIAPLPPRLAEKIGDRSALTSERCADQAARYTSKLSDAGTRLAEAAVKMGSFSVRHIRREYAKVVDEFETKSKGTIMWNNRLKVLTLIIQTYWGFLRSRMREWRSGLNDNFNSIMRNSPMGKMDGVLTWTRGSHRPAGGGGDEGESAGEEDAARGPRHRRSAAADGHGGRAEDVVDDSDPFALDHLNISVTPAGAAKLKSLKGLSGGERSFCTLALLSALYQLVETPFKILDEIDVFVDEKTRAYIFDVFARTFQETKEAHQFVMLTPQGLGAVDSLISSHEGLLGKVQCQQLAPPSRA